MYFNDHAPPHFHALYGDRQATLGIREVAILEGELPRHAALLVREWAELHRAELLVNWNLCQAKQAPRPIDPLL